MINKGFSAAEEPGERQNSNTDAAAESNCFCHEAAVVFCCSFKRKKKKKKKLKSLWFPLRPHVIKPAHNLVKTNGEEEKKDEVPEGWLIRGCCIRTSEALTL